MDVILHVSAQSADLSNMNNYRYYEECISTKTINPKTFINHEALTKSTTCSTISLQPRYITTCWDLEEYYLIIGQW